MSLKSNYLFYLHVRCLKNSYKFLTKNILHDNQKQRSSFIKNKTFWCKFVTKLKFYIKKILKNSIMWLVMVKKYLKKKLNQKLYTNIDRLLFHIISFNHLVTHPSTLFYNVNKRKCT